MPWWFWFVVIGGFALGLVDVLTRGRRREWRRRRWLKKEARTWDFSFDRVPSDRTLVRLLRRFPTTGDPGGVFNVLSGEFEDVEFHAFEFVDTSRDVPTVGCAFALHYPTSWPTLEFGAGGLTLGGAARSNGRFETGGLPDEHDFSRALLASEVTEFLVHQREWTVAFSGAWVLGTSFTIDLSDLDEVLETAGGVARYLPPDVIERWSADPVQLSALINTPAFPDIAAS